MKIGDRLYWFSRNLFAVIVSLPFYPIHCLWGFVGLLMVLTVTDGSEVASFPWEWDWDLNGE